MTWYFDVLRKYADFSGRARRKEYWMFHLVSAIIAVLLVAIEMMSGVDASDDASILASIYQLTMIVPSIAVGVRRMHDTDRSGWWLFVPFLGLIFAVREGDSGENRFGPDPRAAAELVATAA